MHLFRWIALIGACLAGVLLFVAVGVAAAATWILYTTEPDYGGEDRLPGLDGTVTVIRDRYAVPHVFAERLSDAYRALGYLHAQDRFFQMDFARRIAAGRMAEFAGAGALRSDRFMRTLGLYRAAEASAEAAAPATRHALDAYAQGVNAWLASDRFVRPPELVLGAMAAEPWRPADSVAIGRMMAVLLSGNWREELLRAELSGRLSPAQLDDLWPPDPPGSRATLPDLSALYRTLDPAAIAAAVPDLYPAASASNAWVVDGRRTATGKPLLANDPHLGFSAPGWWYLARLVTPEGVRVGATLAGAPYVMIGHNGHVAWGLTTTHADTQDLFVERLDPTNPQRYLTPSGAYAFATRHETIEVRFRRDPETLTVRESRHGPIISDIDSRARRGASEGHVLALAWPALRHDDRTADAVAAMNGARDAGEFVAALRMFDSPMQNIMFADVDGRIGFYAAARVPVRKAGDGSRPVPGWTGEYDWVDFIPFDRLPGAVAPAAGRIVNANNRIVGPDYPFVIAADWPEPFRAQRIHDALDRSGRHTAAAFASLQLDNISYAARDLLPLVIGLARAKASDPAAAAMLDRLVRWDGAMSRDGVEPLVYMAWMRELSRLLYRDELGDSFGRYHDIRPYVVRRMLTERPAWCDDVATPQREDCGLVAGRSFDAALTSLRDRLGSDMAAWRWGALHRAAFRHPVVGRVPFLRDLFGTVIATDGGPFTINRGSARLLGGDDLFAHIHGAGLRAVFDLADLDRSRFVIASGQSGHPLSPFYDDTTTLWRDGGTFTLAGDAAALRRDAVAILRLLP
jgi:penicillin amidase